MTEHKSDVVVAGEREGGSPPCFVRHEDSGGQCSRPGAIEVHGLSFCQLHGEEASLGSKLEECQEAIYFFDRLRAPHVPQLDRLIERELKTAETRLYKEQPLDDEHHKALVRAYPREVIPKRLHEQIRAWEEETEQRGPTPLNILLDSLNLLQKLMRIAHEKEETWLVELLEHHRESVAAQAALTDL